MSVVYDWKCNGMHLNRGKGHCAKDCIFLMLIDPVCYFLLRIVQSITSKMHAKILEPNVTSYCKTVYFVQPTAVD